MHTPSAKAGGVVFSGVELQHKPCSGCARRVDWPRESVYFECLHLIARELEIGCSRRCFCALVAQLDRASDYGSEGWGFEFLRAHLAVLVCRRGVA